jgi:hypothetical protein
VVKHRPLLVEFRNSNTLYHTSAGLCKEFRNYFASRKLLITRSLSPTGADEVSSCCRVEVCWCTGFLLPCPNNGHGQVVSVPLASACHHTEQTVAYFFKSLSLSRYCCPPCGCLQSVVSFEMFSLIREGLDNAVRYTVNVVAYPYTT